MTLYRIWKVAASCCCLYPFLHLLAFDFGFAATSSSSSSQKRRPSPAVATRPPPSSYRFCCWPPGSTASSPCPSSSQGRGPRTGGAVQPSRPRRRSRRPRKGEEPPRRWPGGNTRRKSGGTSCLPSCTLSGYCNCPGCSYLTEEVQTNKQKQLQTVEFQRVNDRTFCR